TGAAWRNRWDSLRLFSPAQNDGLPGLPFPASRGTFPSKDEMADYLESYARQFNLPIRHEVRVTHVFRNDERFVVECGRERMTARNVIVATGAYCRGRLPDYAALLDPAIRQMHS